ncbi:MAG: hypothetical protein DMG05_25945 [Acidobacteria bacterium]|nr:MAG: hypothetical protein DMG05_25945 [Acidobacteriota bacterium]
MEKLPENLFTDDEVCTMISSRAYELYEMRSKEHGRDLEDWLQAESEILMLVAMIEQEIQSAVSLRYQKSETDVFDIFLRLYRDLTDGARSGQPAMRNLLEAHSRRIPRLIRRILFQGSPQVKKRPPALSVKLKAAKEAAS